MNARQAERGSKPVRETASPIAVIRPCKRKHRKDFRIEPLEDRTLLSAIAWDTTSSPNGGDWGTPSNWVGGVVPGPNDEADINLNAGTVTIAPGTTANVNELMTNATTALAVTGGTLTAYNAFLHGNFNISGGAVGGLHYTVVGQTTWTAGTIDCERYDSLNTLVMGSTDANYQANLLLDTTIFVNYGTATLMTGPTNSANSGLFLADGAQFLNFPGSVLTIPTAVSILNSPGTSRPGSFGNGSTLINDTGNGTTNIGVDFDSTVGTVNVKSGTLALTAGFHNFVAGQSELHEGSYILSGILEFAGASIVTNDAQVVLNTSNADIRDLNGNSALVSLTHNDLYGQLTIQGGRNLAPLSTFNNEGALTVGSGSTLNINGGYNQTGSTGATTVAQGGTLTASSQAVNIAGGSIGGSGTINGNVSTAGPIAPGGSNAFGILTIQGNFTQTATSVLQIEINGSDIGSRYDALSVSGTAALQGVLNLRSIVYAPTAGVVLRPLSAGSVSGAFSTIGPLDFYKSILIPVPDSTGLSLVANVRPVSTSMNPSISPSTRTATFNLSASDPETPASQLTFTITGLPSGTLTRPDGSAIHVGDTFTGSPVALKYQMPGNTGSFDDFFDTMTYTVTDQGVPAGGNQMAGITTGGPFTIVLSDIQSPTTGIVIVDGSSSDDTILADGSSSGKLRLTINGVVITTSLPIGNVNSLSLHGGDGNDDIRLAGMAVNTALDGGNGSNTLTLDGTSAGDTFTINSSSVGFAGATITANGLLTINGYSGNDTFHVVGMNAAVSFNGGTGDDTFLFDAGASITGSIDGADGRNTIDDSAATDPVNFDLGAMTGTGIGGTFIRITQFNGGSGSNSLTGPLYSDTFIITGNDTGTVNGFGFSKFGTLIGNTGGDQFILRPNANISHMIDGGGGTYNVIDESSWTTPMNVNFATNTITNAGGAYSFANIRQIIGGHGQNTLHGPSAGMIYQILSNNAGQIGSGIAFSNFANLVGDAGNDSFRFSDGATLSGTIDGGPGTNTIDEALVNTPVSVNLATNQITNLLGTFTRVGTWIGGNAANTLIGPSADTTYNINAANRGAVVGYGSYLRFGNLIGGAGNDTFKFFPGGTLSGSIDGGSGINSLDYSAYTNGINVNLANGNATGVAGTAADFVNVRGGSGNDVLTGNDQGNILIGGPGNDTINAGNGRNILIGGAGNDTINGGAADDILVSGTTSFDANFVALDLVLAEWSSTADSYAIRINKIKNGGGLNAGVKLKWAGTVFDDNNPDTLNGNAGTDWFFDGTGDHSDNQPGEQVN